jgi:pantetheine-phosphate adenylyltransferase
MREVAANADAFLVPFGRSPIASGVVVSEFNTVMNIVTDRLDAAPLHIAVGIVARVHESFAAEPSPSSGSSIENAVVIGGPCVVTDEVVVAIGINAEKKYMFSLQDRKKFIEDVFKDEQKVSVITYEGLTIDLCKKIDAQFILRGLRNPADFEFEKAIAHTNRKLSQIETVFLLTAAATSYISSSIVRDVIRNGGDYTVLVPESVKIKGKL